MSNDKDWFKLNRNISKQEWFQDSIMVHIIITLLSGAYWQDNKYKIGNNQVNIKRGQYPHGVRYISRQTGLHPTTISRKIEYLEQDGFLTSETVHGKTIITICNYATYQDNKLESGSSSRQPVDTNETASRQLVDTIKNIEESKEGKEGKEQQHTQVADVKESIQEKDRKRLMEMDVETPEGLIAYWYAILNCFGVEKPFSLDPNNSKREWASSNDMLKLRSVDINGLKSEIYNYAAEMILKSSSNNYKKKNFSPVLLDLSYICRIMRKRKIVGYPILKTEEQVEDNPWN